MKIQQLSLFMENKPGHIRSICETLAGAGINITTLALADTEQFGILRLIVKDWAQGKAALERAGFVVNTTEVVATAVDDRPGGLLAVLKVLESAGINIEYMDAFTFRRKDKAVIVFRFDNPDGAVEVLRQAGHTALAHADLFA